MKLFRSLLFAIPFILSLSASSAQTTVDISVGYAYLSNTKVIDIATISFPTTMLYYNEDKQVRIVYNELLYYLEKNSLLPKNARKLLENKPGLFKRQRNLRILFIQ